MKTNYLESAIKQLEYYKSLGEKTFAKSIFPLFAILVPDFATQSAVNNHVEEKTNAIRLQP